jgi:GDP-4-dehydro-6-deoxy-D-mannose reductase
VPAGTAFVSGGSGFVGRHLIELLQAEGQPAIAPSKEELDLRDGEAVRAAVAAAAPAAVFHLAAFSSPARSWEQPAKALLGNVAMTLNLLEAVRVEAPAASVVLVGSGQVYGAPETLPVEESAPLRPGNPYAVSKASCDLLGLQYAAAHGLKVAAMRPFNHSGPGQSEEYVLSSLARQIAAAELAGEPECVLRTGNPESARDFADVRDVVRAYLAATAIEPGAYNVCAGRAVTVAELVRMVSEEARLPVRHEVDPARLRAHDLPLLYGSHERLGAACGWRPQIPLRQTVRDTLSWWRERLAGAG